MTNITVMKKEMLKGSTDYYKLATFEQGGEHSYSLPKMIHFIWIRNPIKEKYVRNIKAFARNKDYKVFERPLL